MADNSNVWQWVPWVLVVLGWIVANSQNNERERRKELRSKIDHLRKTVDDIEDMSILHHTKEQTSIGCIKIKRALTRLGREVNVLSSAGLKVERSDRVIMRFRQAITLRNFESKRYSPLPPDDSMIAEIGAAADELRHSFENAYSKKFYERRMWFGREW